MGGITIINYIIAIGYGGYILFYSLPSLYKDWRRYRRRGFNRRAIFSMALILGFTMLEFIVWIGIVAMAVGAW